MKKLLCISVILAVFLLIGTIGVILLQSEAEILHSEYNFSLSNPDIARTVLEHIVASVKNSPSKLADTDLSAVVISGPALIFELDNAGKTLTNTLARYYFRFDTGDVGRVDIRIRGGTIGSSGSGLHDRYAAAAQHRHVLITNDFYGEYLSDESGTHQHKEADAVKADYPEQTFISDFRAGMIARRYGQDLAKHAASAFPWEIRTYAQLEKQANTKYS